MNQSIKYLIICIVCLSHPASAQMPSNRVTPATMFYAGDTVSSPRLGLDTRIPEGWSGVLPRDTEVFLLMPENTAIRGEIFVMVNEKMDLQKQMQRWKDGIALSESLVIKPEGEITTRGSDVISAMGAVVGDDSNRQLKIYAEAKCSPFGFCVSFLATSDPATFEDVKQALQSFADNTTFRQPSNESPFANFDWKKFLGGKTLLGMDYEQSGKRVDEVDLCADGTFKSKITRTGVFKQVSKDYRGSKEGKWDVKSNGENATITFTFEKLPPVNIELQAKDEEIYISGNRYFIGESQKCK